MVVFDFDVAKEKITTKTKMVVIQRSCGYMMRPSLSVDEIGEICKSSKKSILIVFVM